VTSDLDIAGAKPGNTADGYFGNGMPSGQHFQFNLIGVPQGKDWEPGHDNGKRIFVDLVGNTKILLTEGPFEIIDENGTDGEAHFQLPNPDPDCDGTTAYSVFVRALGSPNGSATIESCYTDVTTHESYCASDVEGGVVDVGLSHSGKPLTQNVSRNLLYVDYCASWTDDDGDGEYILSECDRWKIIPLFGDDAEEFFWSYDNQGLRIAQFRFYDVETETGYVDDPSDDECGLYDPSNPFPGQ
jgi:hypothetical protein